MPPCVISLLLLCGMSSLLKPFPLRLSVGSFRGHLHRPPPPSKARKIRSVRQINSVVGGTAAVTLVVFNCWRWSIYGVEECVRKPRHITYGGTRTYNELIPIVASRGQRDVTGEGAGGGNQGVH